MNSMSGWRVRRGLPQSTATHPVAGSIACTSETPVRRTLADQRLPLEIETITAKVPPNATLETLLRKHELAVEFDDSGIVSGIYETRRDMIWPPFQSEEDRPMPVTTELAGSLLR